MLRVLTNKMLVFIHCTESPMSTRCAINHWAESDVVDYMISGYSLINEWICSKLVYQQVTFSPRSLSLQRVLLNNGIVSSVNQ